MRAWASLVFLHIKPMDALMPSATLASTGDGATVPIHTTMAQPLLFSNSGRNVEPIRRRMARRGMRVASEAYTVPMQQPMPRLNKEFGHKVVDKVWIWMRVWMRV